MFATALAVPLLLVEVAGGVDASPDPRPAAYVALADQLDAGDAAADDEADSLRAVGVVTADELAEVRTLGVFSLGEQLRAEAAAEEAEAAERARLAEEERLRLREEREAAEAARRAEEDRIARERAAEAAAAQAAAEEAARTSAAPSEPVGGPTAAQWAALRRCESGGNYQIVSPNGLYHGAYQFYQGTWDNIAQATGRADLVGRRPSEVSPADQDAMAYALYASRGPGPWPHCGAYLR